MPLNGTWAETYVTFPLSRGPGHWSDLLGNATKALSPYREAFARIRAEGGRCELFVGSFMEAPTDGFTLDVPTLRALADLSLDLSIATYP